MSCLSTVALHVILTCYDSEEPFCLPCHLTFCHPVLQLQRLLDFQQQSLPLLGMRKLFGMLARLGFSSTQDPALIQVMLLVCPGLLFVLRKEGEIGSGREFLSVCDAGIPGLWLH